MLDLSKHDCHVIVSTYTDGGRDLERHQAVCDYLYDNGHEYQVVEGVYTHSNGNKVHELAFVMPAHVWEEVSAEPEDWFGEQESILMVFGRHYHTASLVYLEDEDGECASPIHFKSFHSVARKYALEQPCYTRHDDTYYVAE